jgi:hypothetical protein
VNAWPATAEVDAALVIAGADVVAVVTVTGAAGEVEPDVEVSPE